MNFAFGGPGQLLLFTSGPPPSSDKQSSTTLPPRQIERISNHTPSPYRRLQNTSHQTFRSLQEGSVSEEKILQSSQTYRTHLQDAEYELMDLIEPQQYDNGSYVEPPLPLEIQFTRSLTRQQDASDSPAHAQKTMQIHLEALTAYLQLTEIVWHLCELLHLENSSKPISSNVIDWIQKFEGYVLDTTTDEDIQTISRDRDDSFFPVRYYICHGRIDDAIAACTPIDQVQEIPELIRLLEDRKNLSPTNKQRGSKRNQQRQWNDWKKDVQEVTSRMEHNGRPSTTVEQQMIAVLHLMLNGTNASKDDHHLNCSWMSELILQLSYDQPYAVAHEVVVLMRKCLDTSDDSDGLASDPSYIQLRLLVRECLYPTRLPVVLHYLDTEGHNIHSIKNSEGIVCNGGQGGRTAPWSVAHLSDILYKKNILLNEPVDSTADDTRAALQQSPNLRDMYIEKYACSLQNGGGADLAADYLATCTFQQQCDHPRMRDILTRSHCLTDRKTEKMVSVALKYNLLAVVEDICASRASYWKRKGRTAQSLQWLSRCQNETKLSEAVRALLKQGPSATDYTTLDTLLQGLGMNDNNSRFNNTNNTKDGRNSESNTSNATSDPIVFLSRYHETCVVIQNAEELRTALSSDSANQLDEHGLDRATQNLHFLESEAAKRITELLCDISIEEHPSFWLPLLQQLEPYAYRRPSVVSASQSRRVLRRIEEISTSWRKDDFLPPVMPAWEQIRQAIIDIFQTWKLKKNTNVFTGTNGTFEIQGDQYVSLRGAIPILPSPERLGNKNWVDNIEQVITEEDVQTMYEQVRSETLNIKKNTEGESGLVPRMRWALAENLACSLGIAHQEQKKNSGEGKKGGARPLKHQRMTGANRR